MKQAKIWGCTEKLYNKNNVEVHKIYVNNGGYCSKHFHKHKFNLFCVEKGKLAIDVWKENGLIDTTILSSGEQTFVSPGDYHMFRALEDTEALEIYWTELNEIDIERETQGGEEWRT